MRRIINGGYPYDPYMNPPVMIVNNPPSMLRPPQQPQVPIQSVDGILIQHQFQPEKGDPVIIEQALFRGEVVRVGDRQKKAANDDECVLVSQGYASEDKKNWKRLPKITMDVFKIGQLYIKDITKIKARYEQKLPNHKVLKIVCKEKEYYLAFHEDVFDDWFLRVVWAKLILDKRECSDYGKWQREVTGRVYKRSFVMGDWEPRMVNIDPRGLKAYKQNSNSLNLEIKDTKQIWTRFQELKGGYYLIVKLWNGILKEQFAVPTPLCLNWLNQILKLLVLK